MSRLLSNRAVADAVRQGLSTPGLFLCQLQLGASKPSPGAWFSSAASAQPATSTDAERQRSGAAGGSAPSASAQAPGGWAATAAGVGAPAAPAGPASATPHAPQDPTPASGAQSQPTPADAAAAPDPVAAEEAAIAAQLVPPPAQLLQVVPTPEGARRDRLLVRDFIQNSLYHPTLGYFNAPTPPVGSVGGPINYWKIYCRDEFNILISNKYKELETSFLTPAELFSPWYGACIARHMVEHRRHHLGMEGQPLVVVEVGGGNGTLARDVLDWLRDNRPQDYAVTSYTCLEISTSLAARQYDKVVRLGGHGGKFHLRRGSGLDPATWGGTAPDWQHTFVLMMEVLDNLPHDKVFRRRPSDPWQQAVIRPLASSPSSSPPSSPSAASSPSSPSSAPSMERGPWLEVGEPLLDPLVRRTLAAVYRPPTREQQLDERFNRVLDFILARDAQPASRDEVLWLPTAAAAFMELLHALRPNHSLIAADFDKLPDVRLPGRNAPLVAEKVGGRNIDHDTLFVPWGSADIFFPTDFDALCALYKASAEHVWGPAPAAPAAPAPGTPPGAAGAGAAAPAPAAAAAGEGGAGAGAAVTTSDGAGGDINAEHFRQGAVIKRYREMFNTATICAFNPMVDDFVNARFFFGDSKDRYPPGQPRPVKAKPKTPAPAPAGGFGYKAHIPAAHASKTRPRSQQHLQQQQEPVLGGRRPRGDGGGVGGGGVLAGVTATIREHLPDSALEVVWARLVPAGGSPSAKPGAVQDEQRPPPWQLLQWLGEPTTSPAWHHVALRVGPGAPQPEAQLRPVLGPSAPVDLLICISPELDSKLGCHAAARVLEPRVIVAMVHRADQIISSSKFLKAPPAPMHLLALAPHVATALGSRIRDAHPLSWGTMAAPFTPHPPCESRACLRGFAVQGSMRRWSTKNGSGLIRNFPSLWAQLEAKGTAAAAVNITVLGKGELQDLAIPPDLMPRVRYLSTLPYPYLTTRLSSTVLASLTTGTPLVATRQLLTVYSFLREEHVFVQEDGEGEVDAMIRAMAMGDEELFERRRALAALRVQLGSRAAAVLRSAVALAQTRARESAPAFGAGAGAKVLPS
ncbi:hypothetical protein HYH03_004782 [Edaphochlamys debaryana]|uniref:type II protein arginine methyltransferase n=1 Tax=Edaphochlamys debaryana TaxID=47281 RepID=A0A835Y6Z9_9CHLO|nr:hypothetical protein HYH03_004782 [Edaphochlamys debaryana]|eukprot:KAG2497193.1 hypothetical protein HYH03_004782 [Edaphochlamys debaryana]